MKTFLDRLVKVESLLAALAYVIVTALLLGEIGAREIFGTSIWGSQKMAVFAAIFAAFLGLVLATAENAHLRPQFADRWIPERYGDLVNRIGDLVSAALFGAMGVIASQYLFDTYTNGDRAAVLYWQLWPIQLILPYAFYSCALRHLAFAYRPDLKPKPGASLA
jgi:TRAP-type C4-dicarboxylate transport system permease small subunit